VLNLADIFRYFLETRKTLVPFSEELHIVKAYLAVEQLRLGDKLKTEIQVDPNALGVPIPVLSVQPLVENAVKHGIAPLSAGGLVAVEALMEDGMLCVRVRDTGRGFPATGREGVGLENVRRRMELSYNGAARFEIETGPAGSTVSMRVPSQVMEAVR
jgi:LytS/YehU family sensor histidine kinase